MDFEDAPTLQRIRADLAALDDPDSPQARALRTVAGWAGHGAYMEGYPFTEVRVRQLVELAVQRFSDEADRYAGAGDAEAADARRRSVAALTPYL